METRQHKELVGRSSRRRSWLGLMGVGLAAALMVGGIARADRMGGGPGPREHIKHVLDAAGATPDQRAQIKSVWEGLRPQLHALRQQHADARTKMRQAFAAPTLDTAGIEALRKQSVAIMDQISSVMTQGFLKTAQILTPEQRQKAADAFNDEIHAP